jgi:hypothetical protein
VEVKKAVDALVQGEAECILATCRDDGMEMSFTISGFAGFSRYLVAHHAREEHYMLDRGAEDIPREVKYKNGVNEVVSNVAAVPLEWALSGLYWFLWTGKMSPVHDWVNSYSAELKW